TRIARGKLQLRLQPTDAHELVHQAIVIVRADVDCRRIQLSVALEATSHQVNVDPPRMQQVFWNILRNACKFTADTGIISVRSHNSAPDSITLEITDTGIGIEPAFLEKIFDAFEQLEMRREGLGLGLAISKAIVEMHGGSIRAHSEGSGKGATFAVTLPVASYVSERRPASRSYTRPVPQRRRRKRSQGDNQILSATKPITTTSSTIPIT